MFSVYFVYPLELKGLKRFWRFNSIHFRIYRKRQDSKNHFSQHIFVQIATLQFARKENILIEFLSVVVLCLLRPAGSPLF